MGIKEIRKLSAADMQKEIISSRKEILNLRIQQASGEIAKSSSFGAARKRIAQIKTILTEQAKS